MTVYTCMHVRRVSEYTLISHLLFGFQVDFQTRDVLEHKVDRELAKGLGKAGGDVEEGRQSPRKV